MFLLKTIERIAAFSLLLFVQLIKLLCKVTVDLSSFIIGPVFIFAAGCDIFCLVKQNRRGVLILTMIIAGILLVLFVAAFLETKLENAGNSIREFLKS